MFPHYTTKKTGIVDGQIPSKLYQISACKAIFRWSIEDYVALKICKEGKLEKMMIEIRNYNGGGRQSYNEGLRNTPLKNH
jgi:hypothetical protein